MDDPGEVLDEWYRLHYSHVAASANGSVFQRYTHAAMEHRWTARDSFEKVLEVGANNGEHVPYVRHAYDLYAVTDMRAPTLSASLVDNDRIVPLICDVQRLPWADGAFDRVIATCLLHHLPSPWVALAEMRRVLAPGGVITLLLPTDPGLAYTVGMRVTSGRAARKRGLGYQHSLVRSLDHRNHFSSLYTQAAHIFREDKMATTWYPFRIPSWQLNAFAVLNVRRARCLPQGAHQQE